MIIRPEDVPIISAVKGVGLPEDAGVHQEPDGTLRVAAEGEETVGWIVSAKDAKAWKLPPPPEGYSLACIHLRDCHAAVWHL